MPKCAPGCTCKRHSKIGTACPPDCSCSRHKVSEQRRKKISEAKKGRSLSAEHRAALKCAEGCTCDKHALRNTGQFQPGSQGFVGHHSEETKEKLASYVGAQTSMYKHGWSGTPTYVSWSSMISRCRDAGNASFKHYGARGITVCERWRDFLRFLADMGERPSLDHQIDRIDNDGNYEPGNCRWLTRAENNARRRDPGGWISRRMKGVARCEDLGHGRQSVRRRQ